MIFPAAGKLKLSISFVDSSFPKHHRFLLTLHLYKEDTGVRKQKDGESYSDVNLVDVLPRRFVVYDLSFFIFTITVAPPRIQKGTLYHTRAPAACPPLVVDSTNLPCSRML